MKNQVIRLLNTLIVLLLCGVGALALSRFWAGEPLARQEAPPPGEQAPPVSAPPRPAAPVALSPPVSTAPAPAAVAAAPAPAEAPLGVDPARLAEAQAELAANQVYEQKAWATLPTLSLQTHDPVWSLEQEARASRSAGPKNAPAGDGEAEQRPQTAPEGPFGPVQPPKGEIWLRVPAGNAKEFRDIMAQNADLYRAESGYRGPVTVTLWVGGRIHTRQRYE